MSKHVPSFSVAYDPYGRYLTLYPESVYPLAGPYPYRHQQPGSNYGAKPPVKVNPPIKLEQPEANEIEFGTGSASVPPKQQPGSSKPLHPQQPQPIYPQPIPLSPQQSQPIYPQQPVMIPTQQPAPLPQQPSSTGFATPKPGVDGKDEFIHNGQKYRCEWVYCCHPVGPQIPDKLEPGQFEDKLDITIWQEDKFPEYKVGKCGSVLGFCLFTRDSTFKIVGRIIYPRDVEGWVKQELEACLEQAKTAAFAAIATQIAAMEGLPESIPAVLPTLLENAFIAWKTAFTSCIESKASFEYVKSRIKFSVFHEQDGRGDWRQFSDKDALFLMEQWMLIATGLKLIPGIGSFEDLANKIGVDKEGIENFFKTPGKSVDHWVDQAKTGLSKAGEAWEKAKKSFPWS